MNKSVKTAEVLIFKKDIYLPCDITGRGLFRLVWTSLFSGSMMVFGSKKLFKLPFVCVI